jgi:hypothetical protein
MFIGVLLVITWADPVVALSGQGVAGVHCRRCWLGIGGDVGGVAGQSRDQTTGAS